MECPNCKSMVDAGSKFCKNCGYAFPQMPPPPPPTQQHPTSNGVPLEFNSHYNMQKNLPLVGAGLGLICGAIEAIGWFSPFTSLEFGNGPQLIMLPFGLMSTRGQLMNIVPGMGGIFDSVSQITGWVLLIMIALAAISIGLAIMSLMTLWIGVKCLEYRSDPAALPFVKHQINKIRNYSLVGFALVLIVMVFASLLQIGASPIGGGLVTMAFGFVVAFLAVIYLKPHLR